jgi:hypothetical protein
MRSEVRVFFLLVLIGMIVFVVAVTPDWDPASHASPYWAFEDGLYLHNFTVNLSNYVDTMTFEILTSKNITWNAEYVDYSEIQDWIYIENPDNGLLILNATNDDMSGNFTFHVLARDGTSSSGEDFTFIINATNDAPVFIDLNSSYDFPQGELTSYIISAIDEEMHYPLDFNLTFFDCTHAPWSGRAEGENCSIFNLSLGDSTSTNFSFNPTYNDVGTYWANFSVSDSNAVCPHEYCDSSYTDNKSSEVYTLVFNVYPALSLNVTNCSGASIVEGETFDCTIEVTTVGASDELNFSSYGFFENSISQADDRTWFLEDFSDSAALNFYSLPVSVTPGKGNVGNWTIGINVSGGGFTKSENVYIYVDYNESLVFLDSVLDKSIYADSNFSVVAYDQDLLIRDDSVKNEVLTLVSNVSWVVPGVGVETSDHSTFTVQIDHDHVLNNLSLGEDNYSVMLNVSDIFGNQDTEVFNIEILNDSAPVWEPLSDPVILQLTEDSNFEYNVSVNVSDPGETISFYYEAVGPELCSLDPTNFDSSGMINFTPQDCDVGIHNISIIASNGKMNSSWDFVFNVSNIFDVPTINTLTGRNGTGERNLVEGFNFTIPEGFTSNFSLVINDDDFLVLQENYYNESIFVNVTFTNSSGGLVNLFNFSFVEFANPLPQSVSYKANFTPDISKIGDYIVFINITDASGNSVNRTWNLTVDSVLQAPVLQEVGNFSLTFHDYLNFSLNATDNEDDFNGLNLSYSVVGIDSLAPNLTVVGNEVFFNMSSNASMVGKWKYNASVIDNDSMIDSQEFYLFVYGNAFLVSPVEGVSFNFSENVSGILNFSVNHSIGDNLTYEFWIDDVSCSFQNNSDCSWGDFSLREKFSSVGNGSVLNWTFVPSFEDESYGWKKNLTIKVYPNSSFLSVNQSESVAVNFSFKLNISHTNAPMRMIAPLVFLEGNYGTNIDVDLSHYFADEDVDDSYWRQNVTFVKSSGDPNIFLSYISNWDAQVFTNLKNAFTGYIDILGSDNLTSGTVPNVEVIFTEPSSGSSGSSSTTTVTKTVVKFYSIRIIVPEDVIISDENYIDVPFGLENTGTMDLRGIDLSSSVLYNNQFTDNVKINLGTNFVEGLSPGERKDFTMRIMADTHRSGRYKATLFANISSPKFSDWGDFFIDLRRINESEAEELLVFTEKLIADNPECLELTEVYRRAKAAFESGDEVEAIRLAEGVSSACEDAILANEQVRYKLEGFIERNMYYISFVTILIFFGGFIFYLYKRVKFNKSLEDEYVR